jgi:hypothetical protein
MKDGDMAPNKNYGKGGAGRAWDTTKDSAYDLKDKLSRPFSQETENKSANHNDSHDQNKPDNGLNQQTSNHDKSFKSSKHYSTTPPSNTQALKDVISEVSERMAKVADGASEFVGKNPKSTLLGMTIGAAALSMSSSEAEAAEIPVKAMLKPVVSGNKEGFAETVSSSFDSMTSALGLGAPLLLALECPSYQSEGSNYHIIHNSSCGNNGNSNNIKCFHW